MFSDFGAPGRTRRDISRPVVKMASAFWIFVCFQIKIAPASVTVGKLINPRDMHRFDVKCCICKIVKCLHFMSGFKNGKLSSRSGSFWLRWFRACISKRIHRKSLLNIHCPEHRTRGSSRAKHPHRPAQLFSDNFLLTTSDAMRLYAYSFKVENYIRHLRTPHGNHVLRYCLESHDDITWYFV